MAVPMVQGAISGDWNTSSSREPRPKQELLRLWDESTEQLNALWPQIPPQRFRETLTAFGQYPGVLHDLILYVIDNEIHHRGPGLRLPARARTSSRRPSTTGIETVPWLQDPARPARALLGPVEAPAPFTRDRARQSPQTA